MQIGFNNTVFFTGADVAAGLCSCALSGAVGVAGWATVVWVSKIVHKCAIDYFEMEDTEKLQKMTLGCGILAGLTVSIAIASFCPVLSTTATKVLNITAITAIFGGVHWLIGDSDLKYMGLNMAAIAGGAFMGCLGRPIYYVIGMAGVLRGIKGVLDDDNS